MIDIDPPSCLRELGKLLVSAYGFAVDSVEFLAAGSEAYAYVARTRATRYFVKLHDPYGFQELDFTLRLAHSLNGAWGIGGVLPPLGALDGALRAFLGPYPITVHPFIRGQSAAARGPLTESETMRIGMLVGEIHRSPAALEFAGGLTERLDAECVEVLEKLLGVESGSGGTSDRVLDLLARHRAALHEATDVIRRLQRRARAVPMRQAITHGDLALSNFMVDENGRFHVVDWNSALLGPVERDLVFFSGAGFEPFLRGYAGTGALEPVSIDLLAFFTYRWCLDGISFFANRLLTETAASARTEADLGTLQSFLPFEATTIANTISSMERTLRKVVPLA